MGQGLKCDLVSRPGWKNRCSTESVQKIGEGKTNAHQRDQDRSAHEGRPPVKGDVFRWFDIADIGRLPFLRKQARHMNPERLTCGLVLDAVRRCIGYARCREQMIACGENGERIPLGDGGSFRLRLVWRPTKVDNIKVADALVEQRDGDLPRPSPR